jgi:hypothetical protein
MGGNSMGLVGMETPSASRVGGPTSSASLHAEGDRPGPLGMGTPSIPAEELNAGGAVDPQKVLAYPVANSGKSVGNGECFDLVDKALKGAGAKSAADYGPVEPDVPYVWGSAIDLAAVKPGDVVQLEGYEFELEIDTPRDTTTRNGDRPHHSAIVKSVDGNGKITVWEQNIPPGKKAPVTANELYFQSTEVQDGDVKTTIKVRGSFKFYRPQPKS